MQYDYFINGEAVENLTGVEWADDLETYANTFSFGFDEPIESGSLYEIIVPETKKTVIKGIITDFEQTKKNIFRYSGFDCGFYINQNEIIKQFRGAKISDAFKQLCAEFKIPVGNIPNIPTTVSQIFKDKKLSDVFNELIKLAKAKGGLKDAYFTCARGMFEILNYKEIDDLSGEMATLFSCLSQDLIMSPSIKVSMQELRNRVLISKNDDKVIKSIKAEDAKSIAKYGLLQEVETVDTSKTNNLPKIAKDKLKELNKLNKQIDLTMLGDYRMHKGIIMPIKDDDFGFNGKFLIKSSRHAITGTKEEVSISVKMVA